MKPLLAHLVVLGTIIAPVGAVGCGSQQQALQAGLEGARTVVERAEPCLVAQHDADKKACAGDAACEERVRAAWAPVADAMDAFHQLWCSVSPVAEGCK